MIRSTLLVPLAALALASCGDEPDSDVRSRDGGRAEGEIQGGTISDAMIPFDTLTSQSPPMKRKPAPETTEGQSEAQAEDAAEAEPIPEGEGETTPTPVAPEAPAPAEE